MLTRRQSGDTLIEVLFAVTVFSFVVVTALSLMNQGIATAQRSLETTLVRQQVDNQAETLRFLHEAYMANYQPGVTYNLTDSGPGSQSPAEEYHKIITRVREAGVSSVSTFGETATCQTPPESSFIVNPVTARLATGTYTPSETYAMLAYDSSGLLTASRGIWIEAVRSTDSTLPGQQNLGSIDFHIRACWDAPGLQQSKNIGTIVRLYEPRA